MGKLKNYFKIIAKDRLVIFFMILIFILGIIFFISTMLGVHFYDRMIYARYTVFGSEHFYKDVWFTRIFLASLGLIIAIVHNVIIVKIYKVSGRKMALFFLSITILLAIISFLIASAILREIPN
jgi:hypothetical protein